MTCFGQTSVKKFLFLLSELILVAFCLLVSSQIEVPLDTGAYLQCLLFVCFTPTMNRKSWRQCHSVCSVTSPVQLDAPHKLTARWCLRYMGWAGGVELRGSQVKKKTETCVFTRLSPPIYFCTLVQTAAQLVDFLLSANSITILLWFLILLDFLPACLPACLCPSPRSQLPLSPPLPALVSVSPRAEITCCFVPGVNNVFNSAGLSCLPLSPSLTPCHCLRGRVERVGIKRGRWIDEREGEGDRGYQ